MTHLHVLARAHPMTSLARLLQRLKGASSAMGGKERHSTTGVELKWDKGYNIHSVSARNLNAVRQYLRQQPAHHPNEVIKDWDGDSPLRNQQHLPRRPARLELPVRLARVPQRELSPDPKLQLAGADPAEDLARALE